jgi:hypothetical protein
VLVCRKGSAEFAATKVRKPPLLPQVAAHAQIARHGSLPAKPECWSRKPSGYWLIGFCLAESHDGFRRQVEPLATNNPITQGVDKH